MTLTGCCKTCKLEGNICLFLFNCRGKMPVAMFTCAIFFSLIKTILIKHPTVFMDAWWRNLIMTCVYMHRSFFSFHQVYENHRRSFCCKHNQAPLTLYTSPLPTPPTPLDTFVSVYFFQNRHLLVLLCLTPVLKLQASVFSWMSFQTFLFQIKNFWLTCLHNTILFWSGFYSDSSCPCKHSYCQTEQP